MYHFLREIEVPHLGTHAAIFLPRFLNTIGDSCTQLNAKELESKLFLPKWLIEKGISELLDKGALEKDFVDPGIRGKRSLTLSSNTQALFVMRNRTKWPFERGLYNEISQAVFDNYLDVDSTIRMLNEHYHVGLSLEITSQAHAFFQGLGASSDKYKMVHLFCSMFSHTDEGFVIEAGYEKLGKISGLRRNQIRRYIEQLVSHRLIVRMPQHSRSPKLGYAESKYQINIEHPALVSCPSFPFFKYYPLEPACLKPQQLKIQLDRIAPSTSAQFKASFDDRVVEAACSLNLSVAYGLSSPTSIYPLANQELYEITKSLINRFTLPEKKEPFLFDRLAKALKTLSPEIEAEKSGVSYRQLAKLKLDAANVEHRDAINFLSIAKEVRSILKHAKFLSQPEGNDSDNIDEALFDWATYCFSIAAVSAHANRIEDLDVNRNLNNPKRRFATSILPADYSNHREHTLFIIPDPKSNSFKFKRLPL
ncbi:hypothetical protein [Idiomarina seosinensis]|uniref:Uncharacterized protein n=1 Tax=Idiomarina seosinensis TaxID=281739 RepID=A0A432ZJR7_9GAMM|nr:hypothetical protein [Idiomarina seosinensis]RUO77512.1 hypothetical protein CWI81_03275 [Idiomarina seosinensis]